MQKENAANFKKVSKKMIDIKLYQPKTEVKNNCHNIPLELIFPGFQHSFNLRQQQSNYK